MEMGVSSGIDFALKVALGKGAGLVAQFLPLQQADALLAQLGQQVRRSSSGIGRRRSCESRR